MLRMLLIGLLIPFGVGVLAIMELRTPPRAAAAVVQPVAATSDRISDAHDTLAKADRLGVTLTKTETPEQPDPVSERIPPSEATAIAPSAAAPKNIKRPRYDPKPKKVTTAALPKPKPNSKPKTTAIKRAAIPDRSRTAVNTEYCRLSAFGGLRKALNLGGCEL